MVLELTMEINIKIMKTATGLTITHKRKRIIVDTPEDLRIKALKKEQLKVIKHTSFVFVMAFILGSLVTQFLMN